MKPAILVLVVVALLGIASGHQAENLGKCGTPEALRAFWAGEELVRPDSGPEYVNSRHFIVHYATNGDDSTTRVYAESVSVYAEYSWRMQIDTLGWIAPPPDGNAGGDSLYDIYVRDLPDYLGLCSWEASYPDPYPHGLTSYIQVRRNMTPWNTVRGVVAHEFNHASQFRYRGMELGNEWWVENTATWMSDVCFDDVNQYVGYLDDNSSPLLHPERAITTSDGNYEYGGAIWPMFLHEYYSLGCPRRIWERLGGNITENSLAGINSVLTSTYLSSLTEALEKYAVWRYFTGAYRFDNLYHFSESHLWPESEVLRTHDVYPASGNQGSRAPSGPGGANFIQFTSGTEDLLDVTFDGQDDASWAAYTVGYRYPQQSVEREVVLDANQHGTGEIAWQGNDHIALIAVVTITLSPPNLTHTYQAVQTQSQSVDTAWVRRYDGPGNDRYDRAWAITAGSSGNVYVTGRSDGLVTGWDCATVAYDASGNEVWVRRYDGPGGSSDEGRGVAVDGQEFVYVTGPSYGSGTGMDYVTIKFDADGGEVWVRRYNGPGNAGDWAEAIAVDGQGNVFVTGRSGGASTGDDYATVKYNSAGVEQWVRRYDGLGTDGDGASALAVDGAGDIYVTGQSQGASSDYDYATIKYSTAGQELWVRRYNGPGNGWDQATALAVDGVDNVYVTGVSFGLNTGYNFATLKYSSLGDQRWVTRYSSSADDSIAGGEAVVVDGYGNVYVTGPSLSSGTWSDYATIKYIQGVVPVQPRIWTGPGYFSVRVQGSQTKDIILRIFNNGDADLEWSLAENPAVGWLSANPTSGTVPPRPNNRMDVTLTFNTTGLSPGVYHTNLVVTSNDPDQPEKIVSVELCVWESHAVVVPPVAMDSGGSGKADLQSGTILPRVFILGNSLPNPFAARTLIRYALPKDCPVSLRVYNPSGILVRTLKSGVEQAGFHRVAWNGCDEDGEQVGRGVYYCRLEAGRFTATRKMVKAE